MNLKSYEEWLLYINNEMIKLPLKPINIPNSPFFVYKNKGWTNWNDWLGLKTFNQKIENGYYSFKDARSYVQNLNLKSIDEWKYYCEGLMTELGDIPPFIPKNPKEVYKNKGWWGLYDWLGLSKQNNPIVLPNIKYITSSHKTEKTQDIKYLDYLKMKKIVGLLDLKSKVEWDNFFKLAENKTKVVPKHPNTYYKYDGWISWDEWLRKANKKEISYDEIFEITECTEKELFKCSQYLGISLSTRYKFIENNIAYRIIIKILETKLNKK